MSKLIGEHIKVVLLDHDDTLVGTIKAKWAQHKEVARTFYGKDLQDAELAEHWGKPLQELICLLYDTDDAEVAMTNNQSIHQAYPKELFEGTVPALKNLKGANLKLGIITATSRFSFENDLSLNPELKALLDYTQTADDTSFHKPDSRVFDPALEWLDVQQVRPQEVMYVGDGLHDMKAALGAGFSFLGVESGLVTHEQFAQAGATSVPGISHLI